jgi:hypothetical protein
MRKQKRADVPGPVENALKIVTPVSSTQVRGHFPDIELLRLL